MIIPCRLPTDLEIFEAIYTLYYDDFEASNYKPYVLIDRNEVAEELNANPTLLSGRIFFRLGEEHYNKADQWHIRRITGQSQIPNLERDETTGEIKRGRDAMLNFTYMTSILADLKEKEEKFWMGIVIASLALIGSFVSLLKG